MSYLVTIKKDTGRKIIDSAFEKKERAEGRLSVLCLAEVSEEVLPYPKNVVRCRRYERNGSIITVTVYETSKEEMYF
jgi:hypothetical protein